MLVERQDSVKNYFIVACAIAASSIISAQSTEPTSQVNSYDCGQAEIRVVKIQESDDAKVQVAFYGKEGRESFPDLIWAGDFMPLCEMDAFVLLDTNVHHRPGVSFLVDTSMQVIADYVFGEVSSFGRSADGRLFWVQDFTVNEKLPTTRIRIYDYRGTEVLNNYYSSGGIDTIVYSGKSYEITIQEPDHPG